MGEGGGGDFVVEHWWASEGNRGEREDNIVVGVTGGELEWSWRGVFSVHKGWEKKRCKFDLCCTILFGLDLSILNIL